MHFSSPKEIEEAYNQVDTSFIDDLNAAKENIEAFAKAQLAAVSEVRDFCPKPGIYLGHRIIPVSSCCCYVRAADTRCFQRL